MLKHNNLWQVSSKGLSSKKKNAKRMHTDLTGIKRKEKRKLVQS